MIATALPAQCPAGSDPDSPGCTVVPDSFESGQSLASASNQANTQQATPKPDILIDTSAGESLPCDTHRTESGVPSSVPSGAARTNAGSDCSFPLPNAATRASFPAPPAPLTEFQRFVAASTGKTLPIYGGNLFTTTPATFGPIDHGPVPPEMIVGADDELRIRLWGQVNYSANLRVSREGEIYIPKVGAVHVAGMPFSEVPLHLRTAIEHVYRNFELSVDLGAIHTIQVYVTGFARRPGEYTVSGLSTLVDSIFQSGGPDPGGSLRHVLLKRAGKVVADFDLYALLVNGDKTGDVQLQGGDVLYIPAVGPQVALLGSVTKPAIYELRGEESIDMLLAAAGGRTAIATGARLSVERIVDRAHIRAFEVTTDPTGLATLLSNADIVRVDPIVSIYRDTVTLRGAVANPGRFRWHEGMRLSELIPDRDALLKRDYWWRRTQLGFPAPEFLSLLPGQLNGQFNSQINSRLDGQPNDLALQDSARNARTGSATGSASAPVSVGQVSVNALAEAGAKPLPIESPADQTNWNYAVIERSDPATMTSSLIPFALGKLVLDHDISQDRELMAGDVVTVFTQSDIQIPIHEQTKYVTLEGELVHPGVYSVLPGETLRSLVQRAGGFTPQAYLYAAVFTRRSTQAIEQQHLNEYAEQLEHQLVRISAAQPGGPNSAAGQQVTQAQIQNRELVSRVRAIRAIGRIVLEMRPRGDGSYELPDMQLEDGDRLMVPFTPATVQVLGAVYNPHAFLYHAGATHGEYLRLAGGPNRNADRKRIFVLRADGSVSVRNSNSNFLSQGRGNIRLHPGDSVVVPEKNFHASVFNQALGWMQAVSQTSLTALEAAALTNQ